MFKKYWPLIFVVLMPYTAFTSLLLLLTGGNVGGRLGMIFGTASWCLAAALLLLAVAALISAITLCVAGRAKSWGAVELLKANLIMKLVMVPAYILVFVMGVLMLITIFTMGFSIGLLLIDLWTVLCGGMFGLTGVLRAKEEGLITGKMTVIFGISQFIFVFDVITAAAAYIYAKRG